MPKRITLTISDENLKILRKEFNKLGVLAGDDFQQFVENYVENAINTQLHFLGKSGGIEKLSGNAQNVLEKMFDGAKNLEDVSKTIENLLSEFTPDVINELNDLGLKGLNSKEEKTKNQDKKTKKS